jgi:hypothetical protein
MDVDLDDAINVDELKNYITKSKLPIEMDIVEDMYYDAISLRGKHDDGSGLLMEEISFAVRGRHSWNTERKCWEIFYKDFRNYWVLLLLTVNDRLFAL